jgi:hypothetical protein
MSRWCGLSRLAQGFNERRELGLDCLCVSAVRGHALADAPTGRFRYETRTGKRTR